MKLIPINPMFKQLILQYYVPLMLILNHHNDHYQFIHQNIEALIHRYFLYHF